MFLYVKHDGHEDQGNIYISDAHGKSFSLSFKDTIRSENGLVDFEEVASLEGVIIANQETENQAKFEAEQKQIHGGKVQNLGRGRTYRAAGKERENGFLEKGSSRRKEEVMKK